MPQRRSKERNGEMKAKDLAKKLRENPEAAVLVVNPSTGMETDELDVMDLGGQILLAAIMEE
jgi:hypothetical protein